MAEIIVTSTADSGSGSLRQAIADAADGDVILFDADVFPAGQTTSILLSSFITLNKDVGIYGGLNDVNGGYTSGATKEYYVYRDVEGVRTKVVIASPDDAQEGETVLFENICRVALDGQEATLLLRPNSTREAAAIISGLTLVNGNSYVGAALYSLNTSVNTLIDCQITNCVATNNGGFVYSTGTSHNTLNGCAITNCSATNSGGIYSTDTSQNTLNGCALNDCSATSGGGLYSTSTSQNTLNDCVIYGCNATQGGGVYSTGTSQSTLNDCTISDCSATTNGGVVYAENTCQINLANCNFTNCSATNGGVVFLRNLYQNSFESCSFVSCNAGSGGAIYSTVNSKNKFDGCTFDRCTTTYYGGAVYTNANALNIFDDCEFNGCSATRNGGGFYVIGSAQGRFNDCVFDSCSSETRGGGCFALSNAQCVFSGNCIIKDCVAPVASGIEDATLRWSNVEDVTLINCVYYTDNKKEQQTTRYFTTTADTGDGSLRAVIAASLNNDVIKPDPNVFPKGSTITIQLSSPLVWNHRLSLLGNGRRIVLDGQGASRLVTLTDSGYAIATEDVDFVNSAESGSTHNVAIYLTGSGGVELTRATIAGNVGTRLFHSSGSAGIILESCVVAGNFATNALTSGISYRMVGSTVVGNYLNGAKASLTNTNEINSITDTTYSTVGFKTPPPDTLAAENWNADLWKSWDLTLRDDSQYKSGAETLDEIDALVAGDGAKCDIEGCPRKPSGSFGAYEDRTGIQLVTTTADSGAGSLRSAIAAAQDGDVVLFSYVTFPKGDTTVIPLDTTIGKYRTSFGVYGGYWDTEDEEYTSDATITRYVIREINGVETEVVVDAEHPALEGEVVLMHVNTRVALDGQATQDPNAADEWTGWTGNRILSIQANQGDAFCTFKGITFQNGYGNLPEAGSLFGSYSVEGDKYEITFEDCAFLNGRNGVGSNGGLEVRGCAITATRCEFRGCRAKGNGGAVYLRVRGSINFNDCAFIDNYAGTSSGAISFVSGLSHTITNCVFYNCSTGSIAGAASLGSSGVQVTANGCDFCKCVSVSGSGAIRAAYTSTSVWTNCRFIECSAKEGGAIGTADMSNTTFNNCVFKDTSATSGGLLIANNFSEITFNDCNISGVTSSGSGACFYLPSSTKATINRCQFENISGGSTGVFYVNNTATVTVNDSDFVNCSNYQGGVAYAIGSSTITFRNCNITDCSAVNTSGGAFSLSGSAVAMLESVTMTRCTAATSGGAINAATTSHVVANNCTFTDCTAVNGGGVYVTSAASITLTNCEASGCSSSSTGGFCYGFSVGSLVVENMTITDCSTEGSLGGAMRLSSGFVADLTDVTIDSCDAADKGGGIYMGQLVRLNLHGDVVFRDCSAPNGSAVWDESLYAVDQSVASYENCAFEYDRDPSLSTVRYFTTNANSGTGSLRSIIAASNHGDVIEPDPQIFPKGSVVEINLSSIIASPKRLYIRGAGRRIVLNGQGSCSLYETTSNAAVNFTDVDFINAYSDANRGVVLQGGYSGFALTRCVVAGCYGYNIFRAASNMGLFLNSSIVIGNFATSNMQANSAAVGIGSTWAGNNLNGSNATLNGSCRNFGSMLSLTNSQAGFRVAPPNSIAAADWNADLWKQWDLSLTSESQYATTTADDWEGADLWADGDDWRYDTLGLPRKANGAAGAYEDYDFDYYQGDTATSFASPTGWYTDRLLTTPATAIADSASFYLDSAQTFSDAPSAGSSLAAGLNADVTIGATTATLQDVTAGINATLAATGDVATTTINASEGSDVSGFLPTTTLHLYDGAEYTVTQDSYTFPTLILDDSTTLTIPAGATIKATTLTIGDDVTIASSARAYFVPPVALDMSGVNWVNAKRTVYITSTANSGAGSLRALVDAAQEGDFITPDPSIFHKGEIVEITINTGIEPETGLTLSAGETRLRIVKKDNTGDRIFYAKTSASHFHVEDVEIIGRIVAYTPETVVTRCRIYGNKSNAPGITGHAGTSITVYDSVIMGARGAGISNTGVGSSTTVVRSTIAGNTQNLFSGSSTVVTKIDSIVDPVCSEAGFVVPPPDTIAVPETGVAIDWSAWDLHLVPTSPYATGATSASGGITDVEGTTRGVLDGGATRYAQGAYELTDSNVHIVTSNADSGAGSLRAILAEVKNDDSIYFALANFPENQTTTITLNSELLVLGKDIEIVATANQDVVLSGNATVRPLTVCADYSYGAPRKSVTLRNLTITNGRANALTQSATTAISTLPSKQARKITRSQDCGGAIAVYGAGLTLDHCTITNSNATTSGGALYAAENAIVAATGTAFTSNVATTGDGGAVFITTDSSFVAGSGTNFYTNQAQLEGSAIASDRSTVTCNNVVFSSNTAVEGNSVIYLTGVGTFDNCLFGETTATGQYTLYVADDSEATVGTVGKTATDPDLAFKVEDSTLNVTASDYAEVGLTVTLANGTLNVQNTTAIPTLLFAAESDSSVVIADDATLTTETITADGTATFSAETQAFLSVLPTTELDNLTFNNVVVGRVGADVTEVTAVKVGENYTIKIISTVNTIPVVVEYKGENDSEWTVATPSFVGTTFQIRVPGDNLTFRVFDGEKHVTATVRTYGLYPPMRERTEVGYVN